MNDSGIWKTIGIVPRPSPRPQPSERTRPRAERTSVPRPSADDALAQTPRVGLWLDTSNQAPVETLAEIVARSTEADVEPHL